MENEGPLDVYSPYLADRLPHRTTMTQNQSFTPRLAEGLWTTVFRRLLKSLATKLPYGRQDRRNPEFAETRGVDFYRESNI